MTAPRRPVLLVVLGLAGVAASTAGSCVQTRDVRSPEATYDPLAAGRPDELPEADASRGHELFQLHCAVCHGPRGRGVVYPGVDLFPAARDFGTARFRLVSTENGVPTDRDLAWVLQRGVPGSSMPAFGWLPEEDVWDLAAHVRELAVEGLALELERSSRGGEERLTPDEAWMRARAKLTPGAVIDPGQPARPDAATLARGERLYGERCAECHGDRGQGTPEPRWDEDGSLNWARDFTAGFLKGGATFNDLAWRVTCGMPGTAMPASTFEDPEDLGALIAHLQSLIPAGAHRRLVQRRRSLVARPVDQAPRSLADERWQQADEIHIVLAPLSWDDESVFGASIAALHDGADLALRVRWRDGTRDDHALGEVELADGCALQLSEAENPPLFGMGLADHPTNIWHWKAFSFAQTAGVLDLLEKTPHVFRDLVTGEIAPTDVPVYLRLPGMTGPAEEGQSVEARGPETSLRFAEGGMEIEVTPRWSQGSWEVLFRRSLVPRSGRELAIPPGERVQIACAVWNASAGDFRGRKSISIWHELLISWE